MGSATAKPFRILPFAPALARGLWWACVVAWAALGLSACSKDDVATDARKLNKIGATALPKPSDGNQPQPDPVPATMKLTFSDAVLREGVAAPDGTTRVSFGEGVATAMLGSMTLYDKEGPRPAGQYPAFTGSADQLFLSHYVYNGDLKTAGVWHFYDAAIAPKFENARPEYVENENEHYQPTTLPEGYKVPAKDKPFLFGDAETLWYRHDGGVARLARSGNTWSFASYDFPAGSAPVKRYSGHARGLTLLAADATVTTLVEDGGKLMIYRSKAPVGVKPDAAVVGLFRSLEVIFTANATFARRVGQKNWESHPVALKAMPVSEPAFFDTYGDQAFAMVNDTAYTVAVADADNPHAVDPSQAVVPQVVLAVAAKSCAGCHVKRSDADTYENGALFDHENIRHWAAFVKKRGAAEAASFIIGDMCGRASDSTCKTDANQQRTLRQFMDDLATAPQHVPSLALAEGLAATCRGCHATGTPVEDYRATKDKFDPLQSLHWKTLLEGAGGKAAVKGILDTMCGRAECKPALRKLLDGYVEAY